MKNIKHFLVLVFVSTYFVVHAQTDSTEVETSNIQNYTPSKLLEKGKIDIKWFNGLYTQTVSRFDGIKNNAPRENYFTSSLEVFTGISNNKKWNAGLIIEARSNTNAGQSAFSVFDFDNDQIDSRSGIAHIAPSVKISPFNSLARFSIQSSFFIPVFKQEKINGVFLAPKSYIWQNRFFYDYTFKGSKFQMFSELGTRLFFGKTVKDDEVLGGYANNSLELAPGVFFSYFPSNKFTVLTFLQHVQLIDLGNNFSQNFSLVGFGAKYQISSVLNIETLYSKFVRGTDSGLGQTFSFGLRAIF